MTDIVERLRHSLLVERGKVEKADADNERLRGLLREARQHANPIDLGYQLAVSIDAALGATVQPRVVLQPEGRGLMLTPQTTAAHDESDDLLRLIGLDPDRYRTESGFLNLPKVRAAITHPKQYPWIADAERYRWLQERVTATGLAAWMGQHQTLSEAVDAASVTTVKSTPARVKCPLCAGEDLGNPQLVWDCPKCGEVVIWEDTLGVKRMDSTIENLVRERDEARKRKDYARADEIRAELERMATPTHRIALLDEPQGTFWYWSAKID